MKHAGGAPTAYDRRLASEVRNLTLSQIKKVYESDPNFEQQFTRDLFLRLAPLAVPRLNEHTGEDGEPIKVEIINYANNSDSIPVQA